MPAMQALPVGEGLTVGLVLGEPDGDPLGLVLGEPDDDPLGLLLGDPDGLALGGALVLLCVARGLVVPGRGAALVPVRTAGLDAPADLAPVDGRAPGVVAWADVDPAWVGLAAGASRSPPATSSTTRAMPVTTAAPTASAAARRRLFRCAGSSRRMAAVEDVMRDGTAHSSET
jgi:hypothetical protein